MQSRRRSSARSLLLLVGTLAVGAPGSLSDVRAESHSHRVVIDASGGEESWKRAINNTQNLQASMSGVEIEVVARGAALGLLKKDSPERERIESVARGLAEKARTSPDADSLSQGGCTVSGAELHEEPDAMRAKKVLSIVLRRRPRESGWEAE